MGAIGMYSSLIKKIPLILGVVFFVCAIATLVYSRSVLPWCLWKHLCMDTVALLALPVLLGVLSAKVFDIYEFCVFENLEPRYDAKCCPKDDRVYAWEDIRYYNHMTSIGERKISMAFDVVERDEEVEKETETTNGSKESGSSYENVRLL